MQQREILRMGSRLLGIYCLILAIPQLANALWMPSLRDVMEDLSAREAFLVRLAALVCPVLYAVVGGHLLLGGKWVLRLAGRASIETSPEEDPEGLFVVLMQLLGAYFVATGLPFLLGVLAGTVTRVHGRNFASRFSATPQPGMGWQDVLNLLPTAVEVVFGFYLVAGGAVFRHLAFPHPKADADAEMPHGTNGTDGTNGTEGTGASGQ